MRKKKNRTIVKLIILAFSLLASAYAWFVTSTNIKTSNLPVSVNSIAELYVSIDGGETWGNAGDLSITNNLIFNNEVTSDGNEFYVAYLKDSNGTPLAFKKAEVGVDYLEFSAIFRSTPGTGLYLENHSAINPAAGTSPALLVGTDSVVRESSDGNFSCDLIAGAVRVAFIPEGEEKATLVWAPNKQYEILHNDNFSFNLNSTNEQNYKYLKVIDRTSFYEASVSNLVDSIQVSTDSSSVGNDRMLLYFTEEQQELEITIRVWVEGNDREAVYPLQGGLFTINLSFLGIVKDQQILTLTDIEKNNGNIEYSFDSSAWYDYDNSITFTDKKVYFRYKETSELFPSNIIEIDF